MSSAKEAPWSVFWRAARKRYVLSYKAEDGKRAQKYAPAEYTRSMKAQARAWAKAWLESPEGVRPAPARRGGAGLTVREAYHRFIARMERGAAAGELAPSTVRGYRDDFVVHVIGSLDGKRPPRGKLRIDDRDVADVGTDHAGLIDWFAQVKAGVGPYRARHVFSTLRVFFDVAIVEKWLRGENPFRNSMLVGKLPPLPTKREKPPVVVPLEHVQELLRADVDTIDYARRVRYAIAFTLGLRDGEISGLTWGAIFLDAPVPYVEVEQARRRDRSKGEVLGPLKTKSSMRTLPLHPMAAEALREWRDHGWAFQFDRAPSRSEPVFPRARFRERVEFARPDSPRLLRRDLTKLGLPTTGAKGRSITMHSARKTFLSALKAAGVSEEHRKALAGHGVADVTDRFYTEAAALEALASDVARLPLVWCRVLPSLVPGVVSADTTTTRSDVATSGSDKSILASPARFELATPGLGNQKDATSGSDTRPSQSGADASGAAASTAPDDTSDSADEPPSRDGTTRPLRGPVRARVARDHHALDELVAHGLLEEEDGCPSSTGTGGRS